MRKRIFLFVFALFVAINSISVIKAATCEYMSSNKNGTLTVKYEVKYLDILLGSHNHKTKSILFKILYPI